jgi:hypothetical protein
MPYTPTPILANRILLTSLLVLPAMLGVSFGGMLGKTSAYPAKFKGNERLVSELPKSIIDLPFRDGLEELPDVNLDQPTATTVLTSTNKE